MKARLLCLGTALILWAGCNAPEETSDRKASGAGAEKSVTLTWDATTDTTVTLYKIYLGESASVTGSLLKTIDATAATFDPNAPAAELDTKTNATLGEHQGKKACFAITALNKDGDESARTTPTCVDL